MIKIAHNFSRTVVLWQAPVARFAWRRLCLFGFNGRRVQTAHRSRVWTVWQRGTYVFAGSKQQCEDWLDWQDQQARKKVAA